MSATNDAPNLAPSVPRPANAAATAAAPAPTSAGVFGITRTTRVPGPSSRSMRAVVTPAAMEMTSFRLDMADLKPANTSPTCCGFTASTTMSAAFTA